MMGASATVEGAEGGADPELFPPPPGGERAEVQASTPHPQPQGPCGLRGGAGDVEGLERPLPGGSRGTLPLYLV